MRSIVKNILVALMLVLGLASCSKYYKLLRSNDVTTKYNEAFRLYDDGKYDKAFMMMDNVLSYFLNSPKEDTLIFMMGKAAYKLGDYVTSSQMMDQYRNNFSRSAMRPEAEYVYGMSFYGLSLPYEKDQTDTRRALVAFHDFLNHYPTSPYAEEIQQKIEELNSKLYKKSFENAALYYKLGHYQSAVTALRATLKQSPETPYREEIMYLICKSWYLYAKHSIYARQLDRYLKMTDAYYNFRSEYPENDKYLRELTKMFNEAKSFIEKNGPMSQAIETTLDKLEKEKARLEENKNKIFLAERKADRVKLRKENKIIRDQIKTLREQFKEEKKIVKNNETKTN